MSQNKYGFNIFIFKPIEIYFNLFLKNLKI